MSENKQPTLKERQKDLNAYKRTYEKNVSGKGTNVIVGFGKDLPKDLLQNAYSTNWYYIRGRKTWRRYS